MSKLLLILVRERMNSDEAARALALGEQFLRQREYERAIRLLERSNSLEPSQRASSLRELPRGWA